MNGLIDIKSTWYNEGPTVQAGKSAIADALLQVGEMLRERAKKILIAQGHKLTGSIYEDVLHKVDTSVAITLEGYYRHYGKYLDKGVKASRIPFSPGSGRSHSKYIEALMQYARARGMENPKGAAFAIAHKHKKYGMPTPGSYRYSRTGKRKEWIKETLDNDKIYKLLQEYIYYMMRYAVTSIINNEQREVIKIERI